MINNKIIPNGSFSYDGYENGLIGFAENMQLLCEDTWKLIAHQFEGYAAGEANTGASLCAAVQWYTCTVKMKSFTMFCANM